VEIEEGTEESILPKVALAELAGVGRNGQTMAAANQIARGIEEREREERTNGAGLGRLTDPNPSRVGLAEPSGPVGPVGQMGQISFAQLIKIKISNLNSNVIFKKKFNTNSKIPITFIKHCINL
jgi:hypothetical protein